MCIVYHNLVVKSIVASLQVLTQATQLGYASHRQLSNTKLQGCKTSKQTKQRNHRK